MALLQAITGLWLLLCITLSGFEWTQNFESASDSCVETAGKDRNSKSHQKSPVIIQGKGDAAEATGYHGGGENWVELKIYFEGRANKIWICKTTHLGILGHKQQKPILSLRKVIYFTNSQNQFEDQPWAGAKELQRHRQWKHQQQLIIGPKESGLHTMVAMGMHMILTHFHIFSTC